ncbi:MAG TPA: glycoside hydrolase family 3 C-terminal domain-containing protein [Sedimentisphaerales bacterium]|nr:glycoside hydrolase family 3 C-terminal domain-containing protein [Sedimentisphaerales bacterium]
MKYSASVILVTGFIFLIDPVVFARPGTNSPLYLDPAQPVDVRVEDLLARMTLKEKIGQMNMAVRISKDECTEFVKGTFAKTIDIGPGCGLWAPIHLLPLPEDARKYAQCSNEFQKIAAEQTRLGIPLLFIEEGTHQLLVSGATVFPEGLAIGSTWNMDLVRQIYSAVAREARAIGTHQICTLVIEPNRDPRMGRNEEGYSEDPYLCSRVAQAIVEGAQGKDVSAADKVVATLCHFPGQSQPVSGLEHGPMEISERSLRETFLPPWVAGIKEAGALGVMATYPSINGVPAHSSAWLLTKVLREELGFQGCVVGEGAAFERALIWTGTVATQKEAGKQAVEAGVDISIWLEPAYMKPLIENVQDGYVSMETIDRAVRRILRLKFVLGLFENPYVDPERAVKVFHCEQHTQLALRVAREGIVLLKNQGNLLPLSKNIKSIAVIGPNADAPINQLGDYTAVGSQEIVTVLDGIKNKVSPDVKVTYVKGCDVFNTDTNEIEKAKSAAANADIAVVAIGECRTTDGESFDVASLDLTGLQEDLVKAVVASGTPTVVVLINGRPLSIRWIAENAPAILEAWNCGEQGGNAVADVLFGDYNPGGKLPITIPRHVGQLPACYNYKPPKHSYVDMNSTPLFEFGYGLSYTEFEYANLQIAPRPPAKKFGPGSGVQVSLDVKNVGQREGTEIVQLYINDCVSSVTTPVKQLKGFSRVVLEPGRQKTVQFEVPAYELSLLDRHLKRVVEPGTFKVMVGGSSQDIRLTGTFEITD